MVFHNVASMGRIGYRLAGVAVLGAVLTAGAVTTRASADPVAPAASPAPGPSESPAPAPVGPAITPPRAVTPRAAPFGHYPIIDIIPIYTQPQFVDSRVTSTKPVVTDALKNAGTGYDPLDVGGTIKIPITPAISAAFDRVVEGTLAAPNARVTNAENAYIYPVFFRDALIVERLDEQFHRFTLEEGLAFRHRIVGGANTSNNPFPPTISSTEAHYGYVGLSYVTAPIAWLHNSFITLNINADTQAIDHHVGCRGTVFTSGNFKAPCVAGVFDPNPSQNRVWETDQYVQLTIPIDKKNGLTATAQDRWGALNFYENAAFPYRWATSQTYLFTKRFDRVLAVSIRLRDQTALAIGAPYVRPNAQHNGTVDLLADFKLDTNAFLH
jgi:hypothetical protein